MRMWSGLIWVRRAPPVLLPQTFAMKAILSGIVSALDFASVLSPRAFVGVRSSDEILRGAWGRAGRTLDDAMTAAGNHNTDPRGSARRASLKLEAARRTWKTAQDRVAPDKANRQPSTSRSNPAGAHGW